MRLSRRGRTDRPGRPNRPPLSWLSPSWLSPSLLASILLATSGLTALTGCRSLIGGSGSDAARPATGESRPAQSDSWRAWVTLDGRRSRPDASGLYCVVPGAVSHDPLVTFSIDASLGRFESAVITVRVVERGVVALDGIFVSDVVADELAKLRPGRPFRLLSPGLDVVVGAAAGGDITRLRPGQEYQLDLVVQGARDYCAVSTRFRTRLQTRLQDADWPGR